MRTNSFVGKRIGNYQIVAELARGSSSRVYRGEHIFLKKRKVAIKILHTPFLSSQEERERFLQEAQFLEMLKHPYILPIFDVGIEEDFPYLVAEYAPQGSLRNRIKRRLPYPFPLDEALTIIFQVGQALDYAHQQNIIHRDLKPENILFNAKGDAMLADFGIATMIDTDSIKYVNNVGTPRYMAPEQFTGTISKEGDQYALGCIAYELLTAQPAFSGADLSTTRSKHMAETPIAPRQLNASIPPSIERAILKAMAKQRIDRHRDVAAFLEALNDATLVRREMHTIPTLPQEDTTTQRASEGQQDQMTLIRQRPPVPTAMLSISESSQAKSVSEEPPSLLKEHTAETNIPQASTTLSSILPVIADRSEKHNQHYRQKNHVIAALVIPLVLLLVSGSILYVTTTIFHKNQHTSNNQAIIPATGTVSITPITKDLQKTYTISAVIGKPNAAQNQVGARLLSSSSQQTVSAPATGNGTIPATRATGTLELWNPSSSWLYMSAGQGFIDNTGTQSVIIDTNIAIPPGNPNANPPTEGTVVVGGKSGNLGNSGNLPAYYFHFYYGWQGVSILLKNITAMAGGHDAQNYTFVQQSDINGLANSANALEQAVTSSAQSALRGQVHANERLIASPQCSPTISYNATVGTTASSVTETVQVACTAEAYDQQAALLLATALLNNDAAASGYTLSNKATIAVKQATLTDAQHNTITLLVTAEAIETFQWSDVQKQQLAQLIAGKSKQAAQTLLLQQAGVYAAAINIAGGDGKTLPLDPHRITIIITAS